MNENISERSQAQKTVWFYLYEILEKKIIVLENECVVASGWDSCMEIDQRGMRDLWKNDESILYLYYGFSYITFFKLIQMNPEWILFYVNYISNFF